MTSPGHTEQQFYITRHLQKFPIKTKNYKCEKKRRNSFDSKTVSENYSVKVDKIRNETRKSIKHAQNP